MNPIIYLQITLTLFLSLPPLHFPTPCKYPMQTISIPIQLYNSCVKIEDSVYDALFAITQIKIRERFKIHLNQNKPASQQQFLANNF